MKNNRSNHLSGLFIRCQSGDLVNVAQVYSIDVEQDPGGNWSVRAYFAGADDFKLLASCDTEDLAHAVVDDLVSLLPVRVVDIDRDIMAELEIECIKDRGDDLRQGMTRIAGEVARELSQEAAR